MYSLATSVKKTILVLSIILYIVDQAASLICYECTDISTSSDANGDCFINAAKKDFEKPCLGSRSIDFILPFPNIVNTTLTLPLHPDSSARKGSQVSFASIDYECFTLKMSASNVKGIVRSCVMKSVSDGELKKIAEKFGVSVDSLDRCGTDLCNSSGKLSVGLLSLMSSLTLLFFIKL